MSILLNLSNISYAVELKKSLFGRNTRKEILKNISFDINESEFIAVTGASGSGKSTLAKIFSGILSPSEGRILFGNIEHEEIQILFQNNIELINPNRKVQDMLNESINLAQKRKLSLRLEKEQVMNMLEIPQSLFEKRGFQLSGGERQKVGLARILFQNPRLLILDEPFAAQDFDVVEKIKQLLFELIANYDISIVCISHLTRHFAGFDGRIIFIENGEIKRIDELNTTTLQ